MELINEFTDYIINNNLIEKKDSLLLGVSGGPDSLTMLDLFCRIKEQFAFELIVFHLNHKFRSEASEEASFVAKTAQEYQLKSVIEEFDVPAYIEEKGLSSEEGAREIRFKFLLKWANSLGLKKIALAHNRDDLVETVFLNLVRGTGLKGLSGIAPVTRLDKIEIIHPLLIFSREDIEQYCIIRGLKPVHDATNKETVYTRNKIRHRVIPYLEREINSGVKETIARMAVNIREEDAFLNQLADENLDNILLEKGDKEVVLSLSLLKKVPVVLRKRIFRSLVSMIKGNDLDLYSYHLNMLEDLVLRGSTGKMITLKGNLRVKRAYDKLIFRLNDSEDDNISFSQQLSVPGKIELPGRKIIETEILPFFPDWRKRAVKKEVCLCDADQVELPLTVRNREPGDRFIPLGMTGEKKLKDFFIDEKIPQTERNHTPLILDKRGRIIWLAGLRMDERFKITSNTNTILKLYFKAEREQ